MNAVSPKIEKSRVRLEFLDGLRGIAAFYVTLSHAYDEIAYRVNVDHIPRMLLIVLKPLMYGRFAVDVFIVLSGYCLMLPVVRSRDGQLRGGFREYIRRRARRILPPYYFALLLTWVLIAVVPWLQKPSGDYWDLSLPAFTPGVVLSHLFLVHNFYQFWIYKIQGPLWSVATEWQIYFVFPWILLPVWRRFGTFAAVVAGFAVGLLPHFLLFHTGPFGDPYIDQAAPWFVGLFALGMAGAILGFATDATSTKYRESTPWGALLLLTFGLLVVLNLHPPLWWKELRFGWVRDTLVGSAAALLVIYCARQATTGRSSMVVNLLESRAAVVLGTFSYSLYLVHQPVVALLYVPLCHTVPAILPRVVCLYGVILPITVAAAYLFHLGFERRFLNAPSGTTTRPSLPHPSPASGEEKSLPMETLP